MRKRSKFQGEAGGPGALLENCSVSTHIELFSVQIYSYPRLTPSICKSTHQMPGMPSIHHSTVFLIKEFTGSQEKSSRYVRPTAASRGTRQTNRKAWKGRYRPEGCTDTGKKGAMPEPARRKDQQEMERLESGTSIPRSRN